MSRRPTKYIRKIEELRRKLWRDVPPAHLWHRKRSDGFVTIPRTMPLILGIIDDLTKGAPAASAYFELWCRAFDEMYVSLSKSRELAFHSGFTGQRAERTWAEKIRKLDELGFISVREGQAGPLSHALIFNPYHVIRKLYEGGNTGIAKDKYNALVERAIEIGADDLDDGDEDESAPQMWIFGYGSLMSDGWETDYGCTERLWADLAGYQRAFNKKSVRNWGTRDAPGLTLNLAAGKNASCRGVGFSFNDGEAAKPMLAALKKREACEPTELPVRLEDGRNVQALVYIYEGKNLLDGGVTLAERAATVTKAKGKSGANRDYVRDRFKELAEIELRDPAVTELWEAVRQAG